MTDRLVNSGATASNVPALAKIIRSMRFLKCYRGWERLVAALVPPSSSGNFVVENPSGVFAGEMSSFIERRIYLYGGYEEPILDLFRGFMRNRNRRAILDVGGNIGTHSIDFAHDFEAVYTFEPNPEIWPRFERNVALSKLTNVRLHKFGLGKEASELTLYLTAKDNAGLGTLSTIAQYDVPLVPKGTVKIMRGDDVVQASRIVHVDAIKIDVQGFEPDVLEGLRGTLETHKPVVWMEIGASTVATLDSTAALKRYFPYPFRTLRFNAHLNVLRWSFSLDPVPEGPLPTADYIVAPDIK